MIGDDEDKTVLWCCGKNKDGSLGINRKENILKFESIIDFPNIQSIHTGGEHTILLNGLFSNIFIFYFFYFFIYFLFFFCCLN